MTQTPSKHFLAATSPQGAEESIPLQDIASFSLPDEPQAPILLVREDGKEFYTQPSADVFDHIVKTGSEPFMACLKSASMPVKPILVNLNKTHLLNDESPDDIAYFTIAGDKTQTEYFALDANDVPIINKEYELIRSEDVTPSLPFSLFLKTLSSSPS